MPLLDVILESILLIFHIFQFYLISISKYILPYSLLPKKDLNGQKVLITGAGSGLGRAMALKFAARGATLVLWDVNLEAVDELSGEIRRQFGEAYSYKVDLRDSKWISTAAQQVMNDVGKIDILVNNAGVATAKMILESSENDIELSFAVNVKSHFYTVQQFLPAMLDANHGHIVSIASVAGKMGSSGLADYTSTKHAVVGFHDSLVAEILASGKEGVKTTLVCPFYVHTQMFDATGAVNRFHPIFPILDAEYVVRKIVEAVVIEQEYLVTPKAFYWLILGGQILPYKAQKVITEYFGLTQSLDRFHK